MRDQGAINYIELDADHDIDLITRFILNGGIGNSLLLIIRNLHSKEVYQALQHRFETLIQLQGSDRGEDGFVRNQQIGASQFHKNGAEYIKDTMRHAPGVLDLFGVLDQSIVSNLFLDDALEAAFLKNGYVYRAARHLSGTANFATTRKWLNNGAMALHPHDDGAQLAFAAEDGFEIAPGSHTIAANFCIADDREGSELVVWDFKPEHEDRKRFGLEKTGYPYPLDHMSEFDSIRVQVRAGDLYFLNASYVHGVENGGTNFRITSGRFITNVGNKVMYWT